MPHPYLRASIFQIQLDINCFHHPVFIYFVNNFLNVSRPTWNDCPVCLHIIHSQLEHLLVLAGGPEGRPGLGPGGGHGAMSDVTLCDDVAMSRHNKDWTVISGEAGGRGWPVPRDAQNKKCTVGSWRETSGKKKLK